MSDKEAKIRLGIDGASGVRAALQQVGNDLTKFEVGAKKIGGALREVAAGSIRMVTDFTRAGAGIKTLDFGQVAERFKSLDDTLARMGIRGGKTVDELRTKFTSFGRDTGVGAERFAAATATFDKMTFSGLDEASEAMHTLGIRAEDTNETIEEMIQLGGDMWSKLGVPAAKLGDELTKIKVIAGDTNLAGGFLGLEKSIERMIPLIARMQGGTTRVAAEKAVIQGQGYSPEAAGEIQQRIDTSLANAPTWLVRRATKDMRGAKFEPYVRDPKTGKQQLSTAGLSALQEYARRKPLNALTGFFGGGMEGEEAARAYKALSYGDVNKEVAGAEAAVAWERGFNPGQAQSRYSKTVQGERNRADRDFEGVEQAHGERVATMQDERRKETTAEGRAQTDTFMGHMPSWLSTPFYAASAAVHGRGRIADTFNRITDPLVGPLMGQTGGGDPQQALLKAAVSMEKVASKLDAMPGKTAEAIQKANIKVRPDPLGAASTAAKVN